MEKGKSIQKTTQKNKANVGSLKELQNKHNTEEKLKNNIETKKRIKYRKKNYKQSNRTKTKIHRT